MSTFWATNSPGIWLNIILGKSMRVPLEQNNICVCKLSKADTPTQCLIGEGRVAIQTLKT